MPSPMNRITFRADPSSIACRTAEVRSPSSACDRKGSRVAPTRNADTTNAATQVLRMEAPARAVVSRRCDGPVNDLNDVKRRSGALVKLLHEIFEPVVARRRSAGHAGAEHLI